MKISNKNTNSSNNISIIENKLDNLDISCSKCNKIFSSSQSLKLHTKTSDCSKIIEPKHKICEYCGKTYSTKQMLKYHLDSCVEKKIFIIKDKYESEINILKEEIFKLQNKIEQKK